MLLGDISSERGVSTPRGLVHRKVYSESVKTCNSWLFLSLLESFSPSLCSFFILPWTWVTPSVVWNAWRVHEGVKVVEEKECIHVHHCTLSIFHNCRNTFYSYSKPLEGMWLIPEMRDSKLAETLTCLSRVWMGWFLMNPMATQNLPCPLFLPSLKWLHFKLNMRLFYAGLLKRQRGG